MAYIVGRIYIICFNDSMEMAYLQGTDREFVDQEMTRLKQEYIENHHLKEWPSHIYAHIHEVKIFQGGK